MKTILSSWRHHYAVRVSTFLITVALIAGMVGCGQPETEYTPMVAAGGGHTVGLRSNGTVVTVGASDNGQCDVGNWTDIIQVAADGWHTLGLKSDGTVVAMGLNNYGQCDISDWMDITEVSAGTWHTVGLKDNGTVVAVGGNDAGQCDVGGWNLA